MCIQDGIFMRRQTSDVIKVSTVRKTGKVMQILSRSCMDNQKKIMIHDDNGSR